MFQGTEESQENEAQEGVFARNDVYPQNDQSAQAQIGADTDGSGVFTENDLLGSQDIGRGQVSNSKLMNIKEVTEGDDSDIVHDSEIPEDVPVSSPTVTDEVFQPIFNKELGKVHEKIMENLKITQQEVKELSASGVANNVATQFICVKCSNFVVPNFAIDTNGVDIDSVRMPECKKCERVSCYICWRDHLLEDKAACPNCQDVIEMDPEVKARLIVWRDTTEETSCPEIDSYMSFSNKKPLLNILFSLRILHRCSGLQQRALSIAEDLWNRNFNRLMRCGETQQIDDISTIQEPSSLLMEGGSDIDEPTEEELQRMKVANISGDEVNDILGELEEEKKQVDDQESEKKSAQSGSGSGSGSSDSGSGSDSNESEKQSEDKAESLQVSERVGEEEPVEEEAPNESPEQREESKDEENIPDESPEKNEEGKEEEAGSNPNLSDREGSKDGEFYRGSTLLTNKNDAEKPDRDDEEAKELAEKEAEVERLRIEEEEREAALEAARLEEDRKAAEEAEAERLRIEAEEVAARIAAEEAEAERKRIEAEELAAKLAEEEAEAERIAAAEAEAERLRLEEEEKERQAEEARLEAERLRKEEQEKEAALEAARLEAERIAAEEAEIERIRIEAEKEAARLADEERKRQEEEAAAEAERLRLEEERLKQEEEERLAAEEAERIRLEQEAEAERLRIEEEERLEAERQAAEEAERKREEEEAAAAAAEAERIRLENEEAEKQRQEEEEAKRLEEEAAAQAASSGSEAERERLFEEAAAAAESLSEPPSPDPINAVTPNQLAENQEFDIHENTKDEEAQSGKKQPKFHIQSHEQTPNKNWNVNAREPESAVRLQAFNDDQSSLKEMSQIGADEDETQGEPAVREQQDSPAADKFFGSEHSRQSKIVSPQRLVSENPLDSGGGSQVVGEENQRASQHMDGSETVERRDTDAQAQHGASPEVEKALEEIRIRHQLMMDQVQAFVISMVYDTVSMERIYMVDDECKFEMRDLVVDLINLWRKKQMIRLEEKQPAQRTVDDLVAEFQDVLSGNGDNLCKKEDDSEKLEQILVEEVQLEERKKAVIQKVADSLQRTEYAYNEFLNHLMCECSDSCIVQTGCPLEKCKAKHPMSFEQLRLHLKNDCNKILLECNVCHATMRRPFLPYHNCIHVYQSRINENQQEIAGLSGEVQSKVKTIEELRQEQIKREAAEKEKDDELKRTEKKILDMQDQIRRRSQRHDIRSEHNFRHKRGSKMINDSIEASQLDRQISEVKINEPFVIDKVSYKQSATPSVRSTGSRGLQMFKQGSIDFSPDYKPPSGSLIEDISKIKAFEFQMEDRTPGQSVSQMSQDTNTRLQSQIMKLQKVEAEIQRKDKYVGQCIQKYGQYQFNLKLFENDPEIAMAEFKENIVVPDGQFEGRAFWGHFVTVNSKFVPYGFCIMIDRRSLVLHIGSFKSGKEFGLQRVIKSASKTEQSFTQYNSVNGNLIGKAIIEKADGQAESFNYSKNIIDQAMSSASKVSEQSPFQRQIGKLRKLEQEIQRRDQYVDYAVKRYKPFQFNQQVFANDPDLPNCQFSLAFVVPEGPYKDRLFYGFHLKDQSCFVPHGFGVIYDQKTKVLHMGSFKAGKEYGQQRVIKSLPQNQGTISIYTTANDQFQGQALLETSNGQQQAINYMRSAGTRVSVTQKDAAIWTEHLQRLKKFERQIQASDKYFEYCINKYKPFQFTAKMFEEEPGLSTLDFSENAVVPDGPYKDRLFWGQHQKGRSTFVPHGSCIIYDRQSHILQLGHFKAGKEYGPQRLIKAAPEQQRYFMQYTSVDGNLVGSAITEKADGRTATLNIKNARVQTPLSMQKREAIGALTGQLQQLRRFESDIQSKDKYTDYITKKYQPFKLKQSMFNDDPDFSQARWTENIKIPSGPKKGHLFWGHHIGDGANFMPHGFCLIYDRKERTLQIGTFKAGQEYGLQRVIRSAPVNERLFMEYKSIDGLLIGPAMVEQASGAVQSVNALTIAELIEQVTKFDGTATFGNKQNAGTQNPQIKLQKQSVVLQAIEAELQQKDPYVDYCIKKFKSFKFNSAIFDGDQEFANADFKSNVIVPAGPYKGFAFWGHHQRGKNQFVPHGFCIIIDRSNHMLQIGSFKNGKEIGQQRVIKSKPENQRSFMQYTSDGGVLNGQALIERTDQTVEGGNYQKGKQHGTWKVRHPNGQTSSKQYDNGVLKANNTQQVSVRHSRQMSASSQAKTINSGTNQAFRIRKNTSQNQ